MALYTLLGLLLLPSLASPAAAQQGIIVRDTKGAAVLTTLCGRLNCQILEGVDGSVGQVFVVVPLGNTSLTTLLQGLLSTVGRLLGVVDAELDQTLTLINLNIGSLSPPSALSDNRC